MQEESQIGRDTPGDIHILRLGYQDRANLLPLLYPLQAGWVLAESPWELEIVNAPPRELTKGLLNGDLDAAFIPPLSAQANGGKLSSLGGWGIASEGASETARLLAPQRIDLIDKSDVAITPEAQGSTAEHLLRALLKPYYDVTLRLRTSEDAEYNLKGARLLYGDDAARQAQSKPEEWVDDDLGRAWWVLSGVPIVWEMLAALRDLEKSKPGAGEALQQLLRRSQRSAQEQQATIIGAAAQRLKIKPDQVKELFARQRYTLGELEQKGLAHFLDRAARAGV